VLAKFRIFEAKAASADHSSPITDTIKLTHQQLTKQNDGT
jgi:hypothetical protein